MSLILAYWELSITTSIPMKLPRPVQWSGDLFLFLVLLLYFTQNTFSCLIKITVWFFSSTTLWVPMVGITALFFNFQLIGSDEDLLVKCAWPGKLGLPAWIQMSVLSLSIIYLSYPLLIQCIIPPPQGCLEEIRDAFSDKTAAIVFIWAHH